MYKIKVKFLKNGYETEMNAEVAKVLIERGEVAEVKPEKKQRAEKE